MTFPKILLGLAILLFGSIFFIAAFKDKKKPAVAQTITPVIVELDHSVKVITPTAKKEKELPTTTTPKQEKITPQPLAIDEADVNRIEELFSIDGNKLPIVETLSYKSRVDWQKGRPAWLSDYARYYQTSRHFIARSLNGKSDYFKQDIAEGNRFNVLKKDKNFQFYLLVDLSRCKMWFYYDDLDTKDRVLLKTYKVGLGRVDGSKASGFLTPVGKYSLGNKIAIYKPKMTGYYNGDQVEMISIFGTRWIPFDKEIGSCSAPSKGLGIHGVPWVSKNGGDRLEDVMSLGKYQSDGCIRLSSEDMEELFAIIITKPAIIELVRCIAFIDAFSPCESSRD